MCVIIIKDVSRTDSGQYSLVAENSGGKVEEVMKIVIKGVYKCVCYKNFSGTVKLLLNYFVN